MVALGKALTVAVFLLVVGAGSYLAQGEMPSGIPDRDYTLWGTAYVDGDALTQTDNGYNISLKVSDEELVSYTMGTEPVNEDWYVLRVPMSVGERIPGTAQAGDIAYLYINGVSAMETYQEPGHQPIAIPVTIGYPADTIQMSVYAQIPPGPIEDLAASTGTNDGEVDLVWTAPGNNGSLGVANGYIAKYSQFPIISQADFDNANTFPQDWTPKPPGEIENYTITGLIAGSIYYFAVEAVDIIPLQIIPVHGDVSNGPVSAVAADRTSPYITSHNPAPGSTAPNDTHVYAEVKDDGVGVDQDSIQMTVEGEPVTPDVSAITGGYSVTYAPPYVFTYGQNVDVTIYAADIADPPNQMGEPHSYSFIIIANNPPLASNLMITPSDPRTYNILVASYDYYDEEQHPESGSEVKWYKDGVLQAEYNDLKTIPSTTTLKGQVWQFTIRPRDGFSFGEIQTSAPVTILNTPPAASGLGISPADPVTNDDLATTYSYADADGDLEDGSEIKWYRDGSLQTVYNGSKTIPSTATLKGQNWYFSLIPRDGEDSGELRLSPVVTIGNTPPVACNPIISPASPFTSDDLLASYEYSDADNDSEDGTTIRWYKNGNMQEKHNDNKVIPSSDTGKGQQWHFTVRPGDGMEIGRYKTSPAVTIGNTPPVADAGGSYEGNPDEELTFDGSNSYDADGDPLIYLWDFGDGSAGVGESPSHVYTAIGTYVAKLVVSDGTANSSVSSAIVFIGTDPGWMQQIALELTEGWNLISIRAEPLDSSLGSVLSSIEGKYESVWAYDAVTGEWMKYSTCGDPSLNTLEEIFAGKGYLIKMKNPGILIVQGMQSFTPIELEVGWNLVGCNFQEPKLVETGMSSIEGKYSSVWAYDPYQKKWLRYIPNGISLNNLEFIQSGYGYWIDAKEPCLWSAGP